MGKHNEVVAISVGRVHAPRDHKRLSIALLISFITLSAVHQVVDPPAAQAAKTRTVHVAARDRAASNSNPGTAAKPVKTIQRGVNIAIARNQKGKPTKVLVHPGIYRESVDITLSSGRTDARITLVGKSAEKVIISGSNVAKQWQATTSDGVFSHPWSQDWGLTPLPPGWAEGYGSDHIESAPVIRRREMVFAAGKHLRQVMSREDVNRASTPSFYVDESQNRIFARFAPEASPPDATVELSLRPRLLLVSGARNLSVRNMTFRHASTPMDAPAVLVRDSERVRVAGTIVEWNNWLGLKALESKNIRFEKNRVNRNGSGGLTAFDVDYLVARGNVTSFNNWRGSRGWDMTDQGRPVDENLIDFASGQKFFRLKHAKFIRHRSVGNLTGGLWFDRDNRDVTIKRSMFKDNFTHGVFVEAAPGPFTIEGNTMCDNESGLLSANSVGVTVTNNVLRKNLIGGIFLAGRDTPRETMDHDTGEQIPLMSEHWVWRGNKVMATGTQPAINTHLREGWNRFVSTLTSNNNIWLHSGNENIFKIPNEGELDLRGWRSHSGQDADSVSKKGSVACKVPDP